MAVILPMEQFSVHHAQCCVSLCQIAPVLMSQSLLERMKNNFMVVEVWDKKTSAENDKVR